MNKRYTPSAWALLMLVIGGICAVVTMDWVEQRQAAESRQRFSDLSRRVVEQLGRRMQIYEYGLRGMRGAILSIGPEALNRDRVLNYSRSREHEREFPGSRGYGFIRRVARGEESSFLRQARADGRPRFSIQEIFPHKGERLVIQYIEPEARNKEAVGLDVASEPNRRDAAYQAIQSGKATLTHPITLVQASGKVNQGFLLMIPTYHHRQVLNTPEARDHAAYGLAYTPLIIEEILADFDFNDGAYALRISDLDDQGAVTPFFESSTEKAVIPELQEEHLLHLFGRSWQVETRALPPFVQRLNHVVPAYLGLQIMFCAALLAGMLYVFLQIQARRQETLKVQSRLAAIVSCSNDAVIGMSLQGVVTDWNGAAESIFGYSADFAIGKPAVSLIEPADLAGEERRLLERVRDGELISHFATRRRRADGGELHVSLTVSPIRDESGQVTGVAKTIRDISAEKEAEQHILELNAQLERKVRERTANLETAVRELVDFSYLASHDLRTPLRAIDGFSSLLQQEVGTASEKAVDYLRRIRSAAQRMGTIIDDMLTLGRISRLEFNCSQVDLSTLAEEVVSQLRAAEPERQVEVVIQREMVVQADPDLMRIALLQLFDNAWKFTRDQAHPRIEFGREWREGNLEYYINDNGVGFDMAYAGKLFNAFQRLHDMENYSGSGIGLAMVQRILRKHGGDIYAEGRPGQGAAFRFHLPE